MRVEAFTTNSLNFTSLPPRGDFYERHDRAVGQRNVLPASEKISRPADWSSATAFTRWVLWRLGRGLRGALGGEVTQGTGIIHGRARRIVQPHAQGSDRAWRHRHYGRHQPIERFHGNIEFLSVASCIHQEGAIEEQIRFSTSGDGQELYCLMEPVTRRSSSCSATLPTRLAWAAD